MLKVIKRDGTIVDFDIKKISAAITKAFDSLRKVYDSSIIELLSLRVTSEFDSKIKEDQISVEDIQDCVENVLSITGYADVAKAYILYRKQRENIRDIQNQSLVYKNIIDGYLSGEEQDQSDKMMSVYSVGGLILSNSAAITKNYWLNTVYDSQISRAHSQGDIYIHDLDMMTADSAGWSLEPLLRYGLRGMNKKISCRPPKHLFSACNQLVNFLGVLQNEWAGAQSIPSFDTYLAPFVKVDQMAFLEIKKCMETFVYGVNIPSRWGTQPPFSTITFDGTVPSDLKDKKAIVGGKEQAFTYGDCKEEMKQIQEAFLQTMLDADSFGRSFPFPIPTITLTETYQWDDEKIRPLLFELTSKYGTPYFLNCIGTDRDPIQARRRWTVEDVDIQKSSGYFGYGADSGSIGMVTINMPRLAHRCETAEAFYTQLDSLLEISARALQVKRGVLNQLLEGGLYPYTKHFVRSFDQYFGTIGIIGMNEACVYSNWLQHDLTYADSQQFAQDVLHHIKAALCKYQKQYRALFNLEATPGESVSYRLVQLDKNSDPDMNLKHMYYTNSTALPGNYTNDVFEALDIEQKFLPLYTAGSAFHVFLKERIKDWRQCECLVKRIASHYNVPYFTISPSYSVCKEHGYMGGSTEICPICRENIEIWARVAGYYQPIEEWNEGKKQEFLERQNYIVE